MIWQVVKRAHEILFWVVVVALILEGFGFLERIRNRSVERVREDGSIEFGGEPLDMWLQSLIGVWAFLLAADYLHRGLTRHPDFLIGMCFGLVALGGTLMFPGTLIVSGEGLEQVYWFRRNKRIRWANIEEINTGKKRKFLEVTAIDRTKIRYSGPLVDRPRLLLELKRHCGDNLPPDFPREPISEVKQVDR